MIRANYHTHTIYADGKQPAEAMVQAAIALGMDTLGFSEHAYVPFDPDWCLSPESTLRYRAEIAQLKRRYEGEIRILCGIEMDYDAVDDPSAYDYVIGSVHYLTVNGEVYSVDSSPEETMRCVQRAFGGDFDRYATAYFEKVACLREKTGAQIIGHFDLVSKFLSSGAAPEPASPAYQQAWKPAMAALAGQCVFELNTGAMARGYRDLPYPAPDMLAELRMLNGRLLLSSDAHRPEHLLFAFPEAETLLRQMDFVPSFVRIGASTMLCYRPIATP